MLEAKTACGGVIPVRCKHLREPVNEKKQVEQAAKIDDPQQHGLQRIAPPEQHLDRVTDSNVDRMRIRLARGDVEALEQPLLTPPQLPLAAQKTPRFRQP